MLLLALRPLGPRATFVAIALTTIASFALSVILTTRAPAAAFYLLPSRAWELGAGALLALWWEDGGARPTGALREALSIAGLVSVGAGIVALAPNIAFPGWAAMAPVLGTVALIASEGSFINRRLLSSRPAVGIGLVSYSWYLWHWPLMAFVRICAVRPPSVGVLLAVATISLLMAILSWRFIERPFRRRIRSDRATILAYALALACLLVVPLGMIAGGGWPWRLSPAIGRIEAAVATEQHYPCLALAGAASPDTSAACVSGRTGQPTIAVIGDSHAAALGPAVQGLAAAHGWGAEVLAKTSCRPLSGVTVWRRDTPGLAKDCARFMDGAFARVLNDSSVNTVVLAGLWAGPLSDPSEERYQRVTPAAGPTDGASLLAVGLAGAASRLRAGGKRVVIVQDVPYWTFDPARTSIGLAIPLRSLIAGATEPDYGAIRQGFGPTTPRDPAADAAVLRAARQTDAQLLELNSLLCAPNCRFRDGDELLYVDRSHLSAQGARLVAAGRRALLFGR